MDDTQNQDIARLFTRVDAVHDIHEEDLETTQDSLARKVSTFARVDKPQRELDTIFQPSETSACLVFYTVELSISYSLLSPQEVTVQLLSDTNSDPVIVQAEAKKSAEQLLGLAVTAIQTDRQQLVAYVPAGTYVKLATSGTGTATLVNQLEVQFNG